MRRTPHKSDIFWMQRALRLAEAARGHVWPNPPVGCVIVKDGMVLAEAATHPGGRPHAERKALDQAGDAAKSATLYVTLEPCCHWGKTPPCADAIIEAGISRVISPIQDPDPRVNGGGFEKLRRAAVDVTVGLCADEAERVMSGFFHRVRTGVPEIVLSDQTLQKVPAGVDALLVSTEQSIRLVTRYDTRDWSAQPTHHLLARLGELGLTSVAIPQDDPLWNHVSASKADKPHQDRPLSTKASLALNT